MLTNQKTQLNFKGTYFFNKTEKRNFHISSIPGTDSALITLRKHLKNYQQIANIRLSYNKGDNFIAMSTTGKANRYAGQKTKITFNEMGKVTNLGNLLIEKANSVLEQAGILKLRKNPPKKHSVTASSKRNRRHFNTKKEIVF